MDHARNEVETKSLVLNISVHELPVFMKGNQSCLSEDRSLEARYRVVVTPIPNISQGTQAMDVARGLVSMSLAPDDPWYHFLHNPRATVDTMVISHHLLGTRDASALLVDRVKPVAYRKGDAQTPLLSHVRTSLPLPGS